MNRDLKFHALDDVVRDVQRLLNGYTAHGKWSLGQICHHLATAIRFSSRPSEPSTPTEEQAATLRQFFAAGKFPPGREAPAILIPEPGLDDRQEADKLQKAIARFQEAAGPFPVHPVLGPLSRDEWVQFHCLHAAHHLGFLS